MEDDSQADLSDVKQSNEEDRLWIKQIKEGNLHAFNFLARKYQRRLYRVVYNMITHKEDASDLTQDILVKAYKSIRYFKGDAHFYTWLYRIAINTTLNFIKKSRKISIFSLENKERESDQNPVLGHSESSETGDKAVLLKELQEKLNEALQKLSLNHRTVVILFEIEGMSHAEIAKSLGCSEGTVRSRLHYAKEQLKQLLSAYLRDEED